MWTIFRDNISSEFVSYIKVAIDFLYPEICNSSPLLTRSLLLQWKSSLIRGMTSLEVNNFTQCILNFSWSEELLYHHILKLELSHNFCLHTFPQVYFKFLVVTTSICLLQDEYWEALIQYCIDNGGYTGCNIPGIDGLEDHCQEYVEKEENRDLGISQDNPDWTVKIM